MPRPSDEPIKRINSMAAGKDVTSGVPGRRAATNPKSNQTWRNFELRFLAKMLAPTKPATIMETG